MDRESLSEIQVPDTITLPRNFTVVDKNALNNFFGEIARSYTLAYGFCYVMAPFVGLQTLNYGYLGTATIMIVIGLGLLVSVYHWNRYLILTLAMMEAFGCVAHYLKIFLYLPTFSDTAYIVMALLDLIQATFLFMLFRITPKEETRKPWS